MPREKTISAVSGIYKIVNVLNGKVYIGQTVDFSKRFSEHRRALAANRHPSRHMQNSFNKNGKEVFSFHVQERCAVDELDNRERHWVNHYKSNNPAYGYNLRLDSVTSRGVKLSKETRQAMSIAHKGKMISREHAQKSADSRRGTKRTKVQKETISARRKVNDEKTISIILGLLKKGMWTQKEIGKATGVSDRYVSRIKRMPPMWIANIKPAVDSELPKMEKNPGKKGTTLHVPRNKISERVVRDAIRLNRENGWGGYRLSRHFGISKSSADAIISRKLKWAVDAGLYD